MVAIGLVLPLAAGVFDLSIGLMLGLGAREWPGLLESMGCRFRCRSFWSLQWVLVVGTIQWTTRNAGENRFLHRDPGRWILSGSGDHRNV